MMHGRVVTYFGVCPMAVHWTEHPERVELFAAEELTDNPDIKFE